MGLFSPRYVTTVGTSISRVVKDKDIKDPAQQAIADSVFSKEDTVDAILESQLNNLGIKSQQAYTFAKRRYTAGLPSGEFSSNTFGKKEASDVLGDIEGSPVLIDYCRYSALNGIHHAWEILCKDYGYDPETNELTVLTAAKNRKVYLEDMIFQIPAQYKDTYSRDALAIWGKSPNAGYTPLRAGVVSSSKPTPSQFTDVASEQVLVKVIWDNELPKPNEQITSHDIKKETFLITLPGDDPNDSYFHVKYVVNDVIKYWTYKDGSGTYPTLDDVFTTVEPIMAEFYPNMYFRMEKKNLSKDYKPDFYKSSKRLGKVIGLDFDSIIEAVDANPNIKDVEQAFIQFGIPAKTDNELDAAYLFAFFDSLHTNTEVQINNFPATFLMSTSDIRTLSMADGDKLATHSINIKDKAFEYVLNHNGTLKSSEVGSIGKVGTCKSESGTISIERRVTYMNGEVGEVENTVYDTVPYFIYKKQVSTQIYEVIKVIGLTMRYKVYEEYESTVGLNLEKDLILIPLDKTIVDEYSVKDKHELIARSLHFVANSRVVTKLAWYQQDWFAAVIQIVGVVLMVLSFDPSGQIAQLGAALGAGAIVEAATIVYNWVLKGLLVNLAFKVFVKVVGIKFAFLAALVAAAYGMVNQLASGMSQLTLTAKEFLGLASSLIKASGDVLKDLYKSLQTDFESLQKESEEREELLEAAEALLDRNMGMEPLTILGESPDDYYNRTIYSGNVGLLLIEDVRNFFDRMLALPPISTTLGEYRYG